MNVPENILDEMARKLTNQNRRIVMPRAKKKTITRKKKTTKKNVEGNWRGSEDAFFNRVRKGWKKIFSPAK
jgi:prolyl oligopeptidase PreP (S9A serine peptidase family)